MVAVVYEANGSIADISTFAAYQIDNYSATNFWTGSQALNHDDYLAYPYIYTFRYTGATYRVKYYLFSSDTGELTINEF